MTAALQSVQSTAISGLKRGWAPRAIGLLIAVVFPAVFWTSLVGVTANALAIAVSAPALAMTGGAIALFLAAVCAPIMLRS